MALSIYSETQGKFLSAKTPCLQRQGDTINQHRWCWSDIPRLLLTISSGCLFLSLASPWKITGRAREKLRHYYSTGLGFTIRGRARQFYPSRHHGFYSAVIFLTQFSSLTFNLRWMSARDQILTRRTVGQAYLFYAWKVRCLFLWRLWRGPNI